MPNEGKVSVNKLLYTTLVPNPSPSLAGQSTLLGCPAEEVVEKPTFGLAAAWLEREFLGQCLARCGLSEAGQF